MKELIPKLKKSDLAHARNLVLLDTCFMIAMAEHDDKMKELLKIRNIAATSFNIKELLHAEKRLHHDIKKRLRDFLKSGKLLVVEIGVNPGQWDKEKEFVNEVDGKLLKAIRDPSDAVLLAAAIKTMSTVLTKDKHHLFTITLENFIAQYGIQVYKDMHDLLRDSPNLGESL